MTTETQESQKLHRSAVRRTILLPFAGGIVLIILLMVVAGAAGATPVSGIANTMLTVLMLCPLAVCVLPVYLLLVLAVFGMNRVHEGVARPLRALEAQSLALRQRTYSIADRAARASINLNARFAPLDKVLFSAFDRPAQPEDDHE